MDIQWRGLTPTRFVLAVEIKAKAMTKDRQDLNSEEASSTPSGKARKHRVQKSRVAEMRTPSTSVKGKSVSKLTAKSTKPSIDTNQLDQKWSERFSRLEAMLLSKTFNPLELVFKPTLVAPAKPPPAGAVDNTQPFFQPQTDQPTTNQQEPTNSPSMVQQQPAHTGLRLITGLVLPTNIYNRPIHRPLTLSSLLTSLSLTTSLLLLPALTRGPVLYLLTSNRPINWLLFISSPLTGLRLITPDLLSALHL